MVIERVILKRTIVKNKIYWRDNIEESIYLSETFIKMCIREQWVKVLSAY